MKTITYVLQNNGIDRLTKRIATELTAQGRQFVDVSLHCRDTFEQSVLQRLDGEGISPNSNLFFYGSVLMINGLAKSKVLNHHLQYTASNYESPLWAEVHKENMLNSAVSVCALSEIFNESSKVFVRPLDESKLFTGVVLEPHMFQAWFDEAAQRNSRLSLDSRVCVSPVQEIEKEWRILMQNGEPKLWSQYKSDDKLDVKVELSKEAFDKAAEFGKFWTPDKLCTLDLAQTKDGFKIVEFNGIHCCGIYGIDPKEFIAYIDKAFS